MDVIYPLGGGSRWRNNEIRFSIRSLFKHCAGQFNKIFIIGEKPKFFEYSDKLIHIPFVEKQQKEVNIWEKVLTAATDERVSEEFFFNNDDYFFLNDFTMVEFPHFHRGDLRDFPWANLQLGEVKGSYNKKAKRTLDYLKSKGFTTWHFDIHTPNRVEKQKFIDAYNFFKSELYKDNGFIISTCYGNYNGLEPTYKKDIKLKRSEINWLKVNHQNELLFSVYDEALCKELLKFMLELYPNKSPFEND